jgi:YegS/Rv2252/BmrU family lipid kinase
MGIEATPLVLLVNPSSAGGRPLKLLPRVEAALDAQRVAFRVQRTTGLDHAVECALLAVEAGEVPVAISGDGMIGCVGGAMAGSETPLGIIPAGRGNDLARVLGLPEDPEAAAAVVVSGHTRRIDVGEANGRRFLGVTSTGLDAEANRLANEAGWLPGHLVYAYGGIRALLGWKPARFTIRVGEERMRFTGYSVAAANSGAYGGGMMLAPDADLSDGELDVVMVRDSGKLKFLRNLPKVFKGTHVELDEIRIFRAQRVELSASRPFAVYADGEHLTDLPATVRLLPDALNVIVPPRAGE